MTKQATDRYISYKKAIKQARALQAKGIEAKVKVHSIKYRTPTGMVTISEYIIDLF